MTDLVAIVLSIMALGVAAYATDIHIRTTQASCEVDRIMLVLWAGYGGIA